MMPSVPEVSYAVILTRDVERAARAVRAIAEQTPDGELLLVLNDADAPMRAYAETLAAAGARILHDGADLGVVHGWNLALREAGAAHVCIVHEDSELHAGCAARLLRTLRERPDAGAVGPRVLLEGGVAKQGWILWSDGAASRIDATTATAPHAVDYVSSACLMLDRAAALGVGGFDARFFPAIYVDASLAVALWQAGRVVLCDPRAEHFHRTGAAVDAARGPRHGPRFRRFMLERNRARFREAFADWLGGQAERADAGDARHPTAAELRDARERADARELRVLASENAPLEDRLALPRDLEADAARLRRELEDAFMSELIDREQALERETTDLHRAYAELHGELDRVHREHAALQEDQQRLRELAPSSPRRSWRQRA
ncbi:MAG: hypothetical protein QOJ63_518 [Solirubrobacteraceae bacterium]|nr:hypothetical protein [Solirubrobacteraceae bacterium]